MKNGNSCSSRRRRGLSFLAQPQPSAFSAEDIATCFASTEDGGCDKAPEFRLVILDGEGVMDDGEIPDSDIAITLLCKECAMIEAADLLSVIEGSTESSIPVLGYLLLPLHMTPEVVANLRSEVTPEVLIEPHSV